MAFTTASMNIGVKVIFSPSLFSASFVSSVSSAVNLSGSGGSGGASGGGGSAGGGGGGAVVLPPDRHAAEGASPAGRRG